MPRSKSKSYVPRAFHHETPRDVVPAEPEFVAKIRARETAYSPEELANALNVSRKSIYKVIDSGELLAYRILTSIRIAPNDAANWLRSCATLAI